MGFPSEKELKRIRKESEKWEGTDIPGDDASEIDLFRWKISQKFVGYLLDNNLKNKELAEILEIDESHISKILRNKLAQFSTDYLLLNLAKIYPSYQVSLRVS